MRLTLRRFRGPSGEGDALIAAMRTAATHSVRDDRADIVIVCQRADARENTLWLERVNAESRPPSLDASILPSGIAEHEDAPVMLDCVDALYRYPLQGCRVWTLETRQPAVCRALFGLSRTMQADGRLAGMSVYRVAAEPSHAIAFLALERDHVPAEVLDDVDATGFVRGPGFRCYPLVGVWTFGRLTSRCRSTMSQTRPAFWAQLGVSVMHAPDVNVEPAFGARATRRSSRR